MDYLRLVQAVDSLLPVMSALVGGARATLSRPSAARDHDPLQRYENNELVKRIRAVESELEARAQAIQHNRQRLASTLAKMIRLATEMHPAPGRDSSSVRSRNQQQTPDLVVEAQNRITSRIKPGLSPTIPGGLVLRKSQAVIFAETVVDVDQSTEKALGDLPQLRSPVLRVPGQSRPGLGCVAELRHE